MIRLEGVRKVFNAGRPNEFVALQGITLSIPLRGVTVFKGASGSGKTTLLGLVGCMARPTAGRIFVAEREVTSLPERFLTQIRRRTFGFVFQQFNLLHGLTVLENVMVPAYPCGELYRSLRTRAEELLAAFGLSAKASARVEWLSGGEAQRVAIARALINSPRVVIADEPTAHLDSRRSEEFLEIMGRLKEGGTALLIASHDPQVFESGIVDRVVEIHDGTVARAHGPS